MITKAVKKVDFSKNMNKIINSIKKLFGTGITLTLAGENFNATHPLTNFEIQKYYENKPGFNGVYSRNSLSKIKDGAYITNLVEYESIGTHWIAL